MARTFDPNLDDVYVSRNGTIRWSAATPRAPRSVSPASRSSGRGHHVVYGRTRREAVAEVLRNVEAPK